MKGSPIGKSFSFSFVFVSICQFYMASVTTLKLPNEFINDYELTNQRRLPSRRSPMGETNIRIGLRAFSKDLVLELKADEFMIPDDLDIYLHKADGIDRLNTERIRRDLMAGTISDHPDTFVHGTLNEEGHLDGALHFIDDIYYIEPIADDNITFNTIVFRDAGKRKLDCGAKGCHVDVPFQFDQNETMLLARGVRPVKNYYTNPTENICNVIALADHTYYEKTVKRNARAAIAELTFLFREADYFWKRFDFNDDGKPDNIRLQLGRIEIYDNPHGFDYPFGEKKIETAQEFLKTVTTAYDFTDFCLGAMFCQRTFQGGTLGLAPVAETSQRTVGGVCERYNPVMKVSPNSLIITREVFNKPFPKFRSSFTLIHEIGHSFGSPHDPTNDAECGPSDAQGGKFIMSPLTLLNQQPNNILFSPCSKRKIKAILELRGYCFRSEKKPICGNMIVESGEQCDCGYESCLLVDHCCSPANSNDTDAVPCRLLEESTCSARDPCCSPQCQLYPEKAQMVCREGTDCFHPSKCNGETPFCPPSIPRADDVPCWKGKGRCKKGLCEINTCKDLDLEDCRCPGIHLECWICCKIKDQCWHLLSVSQAAGKIIRKPAGTSCRTGLGICNEKGECVSRQYKAPSLFDLIQDNVQESESSYQASNQNVIEVAQNEAEKDRMNSGKSKMFINIKGLVANSLLFYLVSFETYALSFTSDFI